MDRKLTGVGKNAASYNCQSTDSLSLRERAGVRVKRLNTHQPPVGKSLLRALPTPVRARRRVGKNAASYNCQSKNSLSLRERAGVAKHINCPLPKPEN